MVKFWWYKKILFFNLLTLSSYLNKDVCKTVENPDLDLKIQVRTGDMDMEISPHYLD